MAVSSHDARKIYTMKILTAKSLEQKETALIIKHKAKQEFFFLQSF